MRFEHLLSCGLEHCLIPLSSAFLSARFAVSYSVAVLGVFAGSCQLLPYSTLTVISTALPIHITIMTFEQNVNKFMKIDNPPLLVKIYWPARLVTIGSPRTINERDGDGARVFGVIISSPRCL